VKLLSVFRDLDDRDRAGFRAAVVACAAPDAAFAGIDGGGEAHHVDGVAEFEEGTRTRFDAAGTALAFVERDVAAECLFQFRFHEQCPFSKKHGAYNIHADVHKVNCHLRLLRYYPEIPDGQPFEKANALYWFSLRANMFQKCFRFFTNGNFFEVFA